MAAKVQELAPRVLIAIGTWLLLAAAVLVYTTPAPSSFYVANTRVTTPHVSVAHRGVNSLRAAPERPGEGGENVDLQGWETVVGAAVVGVAAAGAEHEQLLSVPWAATGLSLTFLAVVLYLFGEWRRPGPGFALAGPGMPEYTDVDELDLAEIAAKPLAVGGVTSGSGKVAGEQLITVEKPLGLQVKSNNDGFVEISFVNPLGNAGKAGLKVGDIVVYHSSFFGDELWPADKVTFVRSAINACPDAVDFIIVRGKGAAADIPIKRLPKRPAPPRIGRKLTAAQKERATHICLDCGWIYALPTGFDDQPKDYKCPQCQARKNRFARYDPLTGKTTGNTSLPKGVLAGVLGGAVFVAALTYIALAI